MSEPLSHVSPLTRDPDQGVAVAKLCAALRIPGAATHVVNVLRSVGEGRATAVTRA